MNDFEHSHYKITIALTDRVVAHHSIDLRSVNLEEAIVAAKQWYKAYSKDETIRAIEVCAIGADGTKCVIYKIRKF